MPYDFTPITFQVLLSWDVTHQTSPLGFSWNSSFNLLVYDVRKITGSDWDWRTFVRTLNAFAAGSLLITLCVDNSGFARVLTMTLLRIFSSFPLLPIAASVVTTLAKVLRSGNENQKGCLLTRVGHILKMSHEGHLGVFFDPQKEIVITSGLFGIFQPNFMGLSHIWSGIWKYVNFFFPRWRPTWPPKFRIECISVLLSNTDTNKVSIHIKWRS